MQWKWGEESYMLPTCQCLKGQGGQKLKKLMDLTRNTDPRMDLTMQGKKC